MSAILSPGSVCRCCGCTDANACVFSVITGDLLGEETEVPPERAHEFTSCHWVEPDLCSACACIDSETAAEATPLLFDGSGRPLRGAP